MSITIGIPAFNEEQNIGSLILSILALPKLIWTLDKIIVYSDGSTDQTNNIVHQFDSSQVLLISAKRRRGQAYGQNQIISNTKSDILILLNADIKLHDTSFITNLIKPFLALQNVGMTSAIVRPIRSMSVFENIINWSQSIKNKIFLKLGNDTIYLCHGRARAFSKAFYKQLSFPPIIAEDAYSYLKCKELGLNFTCVPKSIVVYKSPSNLRDHLLQSRRFFRGAIELENYFDKAMLKREYALPLNLQCTTWLQAFCQKPIFTLSYFIIVGYSFFTTIFSDQFTSYIWEPSASSKKL